MWRIEGEALKKVPADCEDWNRLIEKSSNPKRRKIYECAEQNI